MSEIKNRNNQNNQNQVDQIDRFIAEARKPAEHINVDLIVEQSKVYQRDNVNNKSNNKNNNENNNENSGSDSANKPEKENCCYSTNPVFDALLRKMGRIHDEKRYDYADGDPLGNFREAERVGVSTVQGIMIRLSDKYTRACNLVRRKGEHKVKDESLEDTLIDLANYSLLAIIAWLEEQQELLGEVLEEEGEKNE